LRWDGISDQQVSKTHVLQVEGYVTEGGKKLASPKLKGFWDSHLEAVPQEGPSELLWKREPIPEENLKNWWAIFLFHPELLLLKRGMERLPRGGGRGFCGRSDLLCS